LAFAAKHAHLDFLLDVFDFTTPDKGVYPPDVEIDIVAGGTCSGATSATDAKVYRRFMLCQEFSNALVVAVKVDRFITKGLISEVDHVYFNGVHEYFVFVFSICYFAT
jgi:hypothetical protein